MGDPMYTRDQAHPDERDRAVDGIDKSTPAPADALSRNIVPVAGYVYNGAIWVPAPLGGGLINVLQTISDYAEDSTGTLEGTIAGLLSEMARGGTPMPGALSPPVVARADQDLVKAWGNWQGVPYHNDIGSIEAMVGRKYLAVDAGAYVSPAVADGGTAANPIQFTGVLLNGRISYIFNVTDRTFHRATTVVDPAGGAVGTIQLRIISETVFDASRKLSKGASRSTRTCGSGISRRIIETNSSTAKITNTAYPSRLRM